MELQKRNKKIPAEIEILQKEKNKPKCIIKGTKEIEQWNIKIYQIGTCR